MEAVGPLAGFCQVEVEEEAIDDLGAGFGGAVAEVGVEDLAADHADVLVGLEGAADVDGDVGGGDHLHLGDSPVDQVEGEAEFFHHAEGDRAAAGLAVVELALDEDRLHATLGEGLGGGAASRPSSHHRHAEWASREAGAGLGGADLQAATRGNDISGRGNAVIGRGSAEADEGLEWGILLAGGGGGGGGRREGSHVGDFGVSGNFSSLGVRF